MASTFKPSDFKEAYNDAKSKSFGATSRPGYSTEQLSQEFDIPNFIDCVFLKNKAGDGVSEQADEHIMTIN